MNDRTVFWTHNRAHQIQFPQGREDSGYGIRVTIWSAEGVHVDSGYVDSKTGRVSLEGSSGLAIDVSVAIFAETVRDRRHESRQPIEAACLCVSNGDQATAYHKLYSGTFPARVFEGYAPPAGAKLFVETPEELVRVGELARAHGLTFND